MALQFGLERLRHFLLKKGVTESTTHVVCDARGAAEDAELELDFRRVCDGDNRGRRTFPFKLVVADKRTNSEGLQLADLTARPIGLSVVRKGQANRAYDVLAGKFFAGDHGSVGTRILVGRGAMHTSAGSRPEIGRPSILKQ